MTQWDLEVLVAELRRYSGDLSLYAGFLLSTLSSALPAELVEVERKGACSAGCAARRRPSSRPPSASATRASPCVASGSAPRRWPRSGTSPEGSRCAPRRSVWTSGRIGSPRPWGRTADRHAGAAEGLRRFTLPDAP